MRITNSKKKELNELIKESGLSKNRFEFIGENEKYFVKFREDFFAFNLTMRDTKIYYVSIKHVDNQKPTLCSFQWQQVINSFSSWLQSIAEDINNSPLEKEIIEVEFPPAIKRFSKKFISIYNEAYTAEQSGLLEICGLGYRKAFEFLIKEYLIKKNPKTEHENIKKQSVSQVIAKYVTDDGVKLLSTRVFWLGNDHAHYVKKWKGKTLQDLKDLIDLSIRWIQIHEELLKVEKSMPKGKK